MRRLAVATGAVAGLLAGCSQINALTPVSGGPLATVQIAMEDQLLASGVQILVAPVCTQTATQFECIGSTVDGQEISSTATLTTPYEMTITVGGVTLYDGSVQDVLDQAAEGRS